MQSRDSSLPAPDLDSETDSESGSEFREALNLLEETAHQQSHQHNNNNIVHGMMLREEFPVIDNQQRLSQRLFEK